MGTTAILLIVLATVVVLGLAVMAIAVGRNRPRLEPSSIPAGGVPPTGLAASSTSALSDEPMTGLESALSQVTDRSGRPIKEHLDAETGHVDELRVVDDTGPLLRRALDHVSNAETAAEVPEPDDSATG